MHCFHSRAFLILAVLGPLQAEEAPRQGKEAPEQSPTAPGKLPDSLEAMMATALRSNPEVIEAEARVQMALARRNQARLKVTQEVAAAFHERTKLGEVLASRELQVQSLKVQAATGRATEDQVREELARLAGTKSQLAQVEAQLQYLMGVGGSLLAERREGAPAPAEAPRAARRLSPEMDELLGRKTSLKFGQRSLREILPGLKAAFERQVLAVEEVELSPGIDVVRNADLELKDVPLRTALLAIADIYQVAFVFREYGVLVTRKDRAHTFSGAATIPPLGPGRE